MSVTPKIVTTDSCFSTTIGRRECSSKCVQRRSMSYSQFVSGSLREAVASSTTSEESEEFSGDEKSLSNRCFRQSLSSSASSDSRNDCRDEGEATLRRLHYLASDSIRSTIQFQFGFNPMEDQKGPICYDVSTEIGRRISLEDSYSIVMNLMKGRRKGSMHRETEACDDFGGELQLFGIFDGHGGSRASEFARENFHAILANEICCSKSISAAMVSAMLKTDSLFAATETGCESRMGTTATCLLVQAATGRAWLSHVGDSEAWMFSKGRAVRMLSPHKPLRPDEKRRIELAGGVVHSQVLRQSGRTIGRVNGVLSVSRAIGDVHLKQWVIATPEVSEFTFQGEEEFVVMASDGLWDVMTPCAVYRTVRTHIASKASNLRRVNSVALISDAKQVSGGLRVCRGSARALVMQALRKRSGDNVTCIVIFLPGVLQHIRSGAAPDVVNDRLRDKVKKVIRRLFTEGDQ